MKPEVTITRQPYARLIGGGFRPTGYWYETVGPDGKKYTNTSISELRSLLRRRYPGVIIHEPWKLNPTQHDVRQRYSWKGDRKYHR